ncbi:MAG: glutaredoxin family protein, partial [Dehalococcoidia bacterium]|nr:glutaredoxin family protein [Dehalococcoidia bacterium]
TCPWCKLTKRFLADLGVAFDYVDVDLISPEEKEKVMEEVEKWNPSCSFPTMVVNDKKCIVGYKQDEIKKALRM